MSYERYKDFRLAPDDNGCWDVLDSDYQQKGTYPSKAAAKRAVDEMSTPTEQPDDLRNSLVYYIHQGINGWNEKIVLDNILRLCEAAALAALPEKKTLETDLALDADEDEDRFCAECGQYEFEGTLYCRCVGFNQAIATAQANIHSVFGGKSDD